MEKFLKHRKTISCISSAIYGLLMICIIIGISMLSSPALQIPKQTIFYPVIPLVMVCIQLLIKAFMSKKDDKKSKKTFITSYVVLIVLTLLYAVATANSLMILARIGSLPDYTSTLADVIIQIISFVMALIFIVVEGILLAKIKKDTPEKYEIRIKAKEEKKRAKEEQRRQVEEAKKAQTENYTNLPAVDVDGKKLSYFDGRLLQFIFYNFAWKILNYITLGIMVPFTTCWAMKWKYEHTVYSGKRLVFTGNGFSLIKKWIIWTLLTILTFGIYGFWLKIKLEQWKAEHTVLSDDQK